MKIIRLKSQKYKKISINFLVWTNNSFISKIEVPLFSLNINIGNMPLKPTNTVLKSAHRNGRDIKLELSVVLTCLFDLVPSVNNSSKSDSSWTWKTFTNLSSCLWLLPALCMLITCWVSRNRLEYTIAEITTTSGTVNWHIRRTELQTIVDF